MNLPHTFEKAASRLMSVQSAPIGVYDLSSKFDSHMDARGVTGFHAAGASPQRQVVGVGIGKCGVFQVSDFLNGSDTTSSLQDDTIHYLSPATPLSTRTVNEGDYYPTLMKFFEVERVAEASYISSSEISCMEPELQRTIAIVRPEAMQYEDVILRAVHEAGFTIVDARRVHLTPEQVSEIYSQHYGSPIFPYVVVSMSVSPVLSISLAAINVVTRWRDIVGPEKVLPSEWFYPMSMRVRFGIHEPIVNALHASENLAEANRENRFFFPENTLEPLLVEEEKVTDYCLKYLHTTLLEGLTKVLLAKPADPIMYLAEWLLLHNPYQPRFPAEISLLPT